MQGLDWLGLAGFGWVELAGFGWADLETGKSPRDTGKSPSKTKNAIETTCSSLLAVSVAVLLFVGLFFQLGGLASAGNSTHLNLNFNSNLNVRLHCQTNKFKR